MIIDMKWLWFAVVFFAVVGLSGCDSMSKSWSAGGSVNASTHLDSKAAPDAASGAANSAPTTASSDSGDQVDNGETNAITQGEDDASKARRDKARSSLGLK
jgi:hypothetical protein